jgi:hypothetical protein
MTELWGSVIQFVVCQFYVYQSVCRLVQKYECVNGVCLHLGRCGVFDGQGISVLERR